MSLTEKKSTAIIAMAGAFQFTGCSNTHSSVPYWFSNAVLDGLVVAHSDHIVINAAQGHMRATIGDYIVKYTDGNLSVIERAVFENSCTIIAKKTPNPTPIIKYFAYEHLPPHLQMVSKPISDLAHQMDAVLPDGPEKTTGLRKLLEAKDCFVRQALNNK